VKIRLTGTEDEYREGARRLAEIFTVVSADGPRPGRGGGLLRFSYLDVRLTPPGPGDRHAG
jgi:hypothetical protein